MNRRAHGDDGFIGGFAAVLFGLLMFVAGTLLTAYAWGVVDTKTAALEAARQATRAYVEASSAEVAADAAVGAAREALAAAGRDPSRATVDLTGSGFERCGRVVVAVAYRAPLLDLPFVGPVGSAGMVRGVHSELVDPYRSGLTGLARCA